MDAPFGLFPVSVIKPLKGCDEGLAPIWSRFLNSIIPSSSFDSAWPLGRNLAVAVVRELMRAYPRVRAFLSSDAVDIGSTPRSTT